MLDLYTLVPAAMVDHDEGHARRILNASLTLLVVTDEV
jgi:hypothetical protein